MEQQATAANAGHTSGFAIIMGEAGTGKSVENILSWAGCGLFLAQPGALRGAETVCGWSLAGQTHEVRFMEDIPGCIQWAVENGFGAVIIDDGSLIMGNTAARALERFTVKSKKTGEEGVDFAMYPYLGKVVQDVVTASRWCGIHVIMNTHIQPAFQDKKTGEQYPAGPDFAWKKLVRLGPHSSDLTMLAIKGDPNAGKWDTIADCNPRDPFYIMKDRFERAIPSRGPLNTAEIMRAAGYTVARPQRLLWMEEVAEGVATLIMQGASESQAREPFKAKLMEANCPHEWIRWALRDGTHRGRLRKHRSTSVLADL